MYSSINTNRLADLVIDVELQRVNPVKRREKVYIGCGAGFGGDRPMASLKLLQRVEQLNYLVLECLAERTLADRFQIMLSGGRGYDSRSMFFVSSFLSFCLLFVSLILIFCYFFQQFSVSDWMNLLLPLAVDRGTCIITNMGASKLVED